MRPPGTTHVTHRAGPSGMPVPPDRAPPPPASPAGLTAATVSPPPGSPPPEFFGDSLAREIAALDAPRPPSPPPEFTGDSLVRDIAALAAQRPPSPPPEFSGDALAREIAASKTRFELDGVSGRLQVDLNAPAARFTRQEVPAVYQDGAVVAESMAGPLASPQR